jgi:hypothetical protein
MADKKPHAGHGFVKTTIEHFNDNSAVVHHHHEDGPHKDIKHAVGSLDECHDSIEDCLRQKGIDPEKIEEAIDPGIHARALDKLAKETGKDDEEAEEKVSPGLHEKMQKMVE